MAEALTIRSSQVIGHTPARFRGRIVVLFMTAFVMGATVSCVSTFPAGDSMVVSVLDVQQGKVEKGVRVRWGGTIAQIHNNEGVTVLEIVSRPLWRSGRPKHNDVTDGRFMAEINGFLDPEIMSPGRDISVIGTIDRVDTGFVGKAEYRYPVLAVFDYKFWQKQSEIDPREDDPYYLFSNGYWRNWPDKRGATVRGHLIF